MPQQSLLTRGIKFTPLLVILWATVWVVAPRWGAATIKRPVSYTHLTLPTICSV